MKLSILNGYFGGGGGGRSSSKSARSSKIGLIRSSTTGTNMAITGSIGLLLIWSFVGDCVGKPFHNQGGQAEIEEDTTQGSLKEKFPPGTLMLGSSSTGGGIHSPLIDDSLLEDIGDDDDSNNEDDTAVMVGNVGLLPLGTQDDSLQRWGDYKPHHHVVKQSTGNLNYGTVVHKRSLGGGGGGRSPYSLDEGGGDEEYQQQRLQRFSRDNNRPTYYEQTSGVSAPVAAAAAAGVEPVSTSGIRQKLMHLRNQYGDKWYAFMGPYAYRKRQILYRQCFFNPISCF